MDEMGSEFWLEEAYGLPSADVSAAPPHWLSMGEDRAFLFSGRTAIDYVLEDLRACGKLPPGARAYMPSYCCHAMLQPFLERRIAISFYDVTLRSNRLGYSIDEHTACDIFFATSYFGFSATTMEAEIERFAQKGVVVLEDITHRLLSGPPLRGRADYRIASLRKWAPLASGGVAVKCSGRFCGPSTRQAPAYIQTRIEAMREKGRYLRGRKDAAGKECYLSLFRRFNRALEEDYRGYAMDDLSRRLIAELPLDEVRSRRRENARVLTELLSGQEEARPLVDEMDINQDCPLFFPVRVKANRRDALRDHLRAYGIYCPVHWPVPEEVPLNGQSQKIYEEELSLICDQRYGTGQMQKLAQAIKEFRGRG